MKWGTTISKPNSGFADGFDQRIHYVIYNIGAVLYLPCITGMLSNTVSIPK